MINRDTPHNELLIRLNGFYQDYKLMKEHTRKEIYNYLEKNFPEEKSEIWCRSYVDLHTLEHFPNRMDDIHIILSTKKILTDIDLKDFCSEFNVELFKVGIETEGVVGFLPQSFMDKKLRDSGKLFYHFKRDKTECVSFGETIL